MPVEHGSSVLQKKKTVGLRSLATIEQQQMGSCPPPQKKKNLVTEGKKGTEDGAVDQQYRPTHVTNNDADEHRAGVSLTKLPVFRPIYMGTLKGLRQGHSGNDLVRVIYSRTAQREPYTLSVVIIQKLVNY